MQESVFTVTSHRQIARDIRELVLKGDTGPVTAPGQFVNVRLEGFFLRRPISVCNVEGDELTLVYKTVGKGTRAMSLLAEGAELSLLTGLGNGYHMELAGSRPLLLGGGVGVPPLYLLARRLTAQGKSVTAALGFNTAEDVFYADAFRSLGCEVRVATADGSLGTKGFVTDLLDGLDPTYYYACGPMPMLRAVYDRVTGEGEMSFEERMGCGFGACMGCSWMTKAGPKRVCKDGPVFRKEEILWDGQA